MVWNSHQQGERSEAFQQLEPSEGESQAETEAVSAGAGLARVGLLSWQGVSAGVSSKCFKMCVTWRGGWRGEGALWGCSVCARGEGGRAGPPVPAGEGCAQPGLMVVVGAAGSLGSESGLGSQAVHVL